MFGPRVGVSVKIGAARLVLGVWGATNMSWPTRSPAIPICVSIFIKAFKNTVTIRLAQHSLLGSRTVTYRSSSTTRATSTPTMAVKHSVLAREGN